MAGHSHWSSIRIRKGAQDARKGRLFSKVSKEIMTASRLAGGDPAKNLRLRIAIEHAKAVNMPKETVERAILKGTGALPGQHLEEVTYEGYSPGGGAVMVEVLTDNRNRTAPEIRKIFEMHGGSLGATGCVSWIFEAKGLFVVDKEKISEDELMGAALQAEAEDVKSFDDAYEVYSTPKDFEAVRSKLKELSVPVRASEIARISRTSVAPSEADARKALALIRDLHEHDDVQNVYHNLELPVELLEEAA